MDHAHYMDKALELAQSALNRGDFPVGALMVYHDRVIAKGVRTGTTLAGKTGLVNEVDHAEIGALRQLYQLNSTIKPGDITFYTTMEPCLMCYAAILLAGINTIVYAYEDAMGGGTRLNLKSLAPLYRERNMTIIPTIKRRESILLFKAFFNNDNNAYWRDSYLAQYTLAQK